MAKLRKPGGEGYVLSVATFAYGVWGDIGMEDEAG